MSYERIDLLPQNVADFIKEKRELSLKREQFGFNVTIPLKEVVLPFIDHASPEVSLVGACNVLMIQNGKVHGINSDINGIIDTLNLYSEVVRLKTCFIIGTGGAAKAAAFALAELGANEIYLSTRVNKEPIELNRWIQSMEIKFPNLKLKVVQGSDAGLKEFGLVVNATPVGMSGSQFTLSEAEEFFKPFANLKLSKNALAFDLIYTPQMTAFLQVMSKVSNKQVGGLKMLISQAMKTWNWWMASSVPLEEQEELEKILKGVLNIKAQKRPLFLCGFMGSGKSSVGKKMAHTLGIPFVDLDECIEKKVGKTIAEIFAVGNDHFREIESAVLKELDMDGAQFIALGGGTLGFFDHHEWLNRRGTLVYLKADVSTIEERLQAQEQISNRPLLRGDWKLLFKERQVIYAKAAFHVAVDQKCVEQVMWDTFKELA